MRRGFTVIELLVALALAGIVVLISQRLFASATGAATVLLRTREELDANANRQRWLEQAFLSLAVGQAGDPSFDGGETSLDTATWVTVPQGWRERQRLMLRVEADGVQVEIGENTFPLAERLVGARFEYLTTDGDGSRWVGGWASVLGAPGAVRVILEHPPGTVSDTCVFLIGERG